MANQSNSNDGEKDILGIEAEFEASALRSKVAELEKELLRLQQIIRDNDLDIEDIPDMSDEEYICISQISKFRALSDQGAFTQEDAKIFDTLVKDLYIIRGKLGAENRKGKKKTKAEIKDLLKIARGED